MANTKAPIAKVADKISGYFVQAILCIAIVSFIIWLIISQSFATSINIFISLLVIACPCSLGLATPLAIVIASGLSAKNGILVKNSETIENAHKVKKIVFDKTGTLTKGELTVSKIYNYSNFEEKDLMKLVGSIEVKSEHPIAKAIIEYCTEIELDNISEFKVFPGLGIKANYIEKEVYIGNKKFMVENNIIIKESHNQDEEVLSNEGNSIIYVGIENEIKALIGAKDTIKPEAIETIKRLKEQNIEIIMLTGDNEKTATAIANQIGIDKIIAGVMPTEKSKEIEKLKEENSLIMMVGDGINDAPSLTKADIGVSVASGTDIAIDSSDVVLMNNSIIYINDLIYISKKTIGNIKQNLFWAFFYNICMIPIAAGVFTKWDIVLNPMIAAFAMTLSSLTVVFNALRLRTIKIKGGN